MDELADPFEAARRTGGGEASFVVHVRTRETSLDRFEHQSHTPMIAASIAKLGIALYAEHLAGSGSVSWDDQLMLKNNHKRYGTGVLRHFPAGTILTLRQTHLLMLSESDNTATNLVLERVGPQRKINAWLQGRGIRRSGLTNRSDRLFESGEMTAADAMSLLELIDDEAPVTLAAMRRNHFRRGLRRDLERHPGWTREYYRLGKAIGQGAARARPISEPLARAGLLVATHRPESRVAAGKDGLLNFEGHDYRHEAARIGLGNGRPYALVTAFTRDANPNALPMLGRVTVDLLRRYAL